LDLFLHPGSGSCIRRSKSTGSGSATFLVWIRIWIHQNPVLGFIKSRSVTSTRILRSPRIDSEESIRQAGSRFLGSLQDLQIRAPALSCNLIAVTQHLFLCRYYITYHQWNSKPEFIVATHKVVNYKDVLDQSNKPTQVAALLLTPNSLLAE
jgi:hypothetical protein